MVAVVPAGKGSWGWLLTCEFEFTQIKDLGITKMTTTFTFDDLI